MYPVFENDQCNSVSFCKWSTSLFDSHFPPVLVKSSEILSKMHKNIRIAFLISVWGSPVDDLNSSNVQWRTKQLVIAVSENAVNAFWIIRYNSSSNILWINSSILFFLIFIHFCWSSVKVVTYSGILWQCAISWWYVLQRKKMCKEKFSHWFWICQL